MVDHTRPWAKNIWLYVLSKSTEFIDFYYELLLHVIINIPISDSARSEKITQNDQKLSFHDQSTKF